MAEQKDKLKIDKLFAFIADGTEGEGIAAYVNEHGSHPLIGADMKRIDSLRDVAQTIADVSGKEVKLCEFSLRTELEVIKPR